MLLRTAALGLVAAVLAGALVPCGGPPPEAPAAAASVLAGAAADDGAWCGRSEPPQLVPACPCGCAQRPQVAGVPVGVGLAVRAAPPRLEVAPAPPSAPLLPACRACAGVVRTPDPVPLVAAS
jgi:hypothetical protein